MANELIMRDISRRYAPLSKDSVEHGLRQRSFSRIVDDIDNAFVNDIEADRWFCDEVDYINKRIADVEFDLDAVNRAFSSGRLTRDEFELVQGRLSDLGLAVVAEAKVCVDAARVWDGVYGTEYMKLVDDIVVPEVDFDDLKKPVDSPVVEAEREAAENAELEAELAEELAAEQAELEAELEREAAEEEERAAREAAQAELDRQMEEAEEMRREAEERAQREREAIERLPPRARRNAEALGFGE